MTGQCTVMGLSGSRFFKLVKLKATNIIKVAVTDLQIESAQDCYLFFQCFEKKHCGEDVRTLIGICSHDSMLSKEPGLSLSLDRNRQP